ncbi:zinc-dependent alcohol dehydrogenase [Sphingomonas sp. LT1P40]|uniref:zinc-dependent alcohol dehydrogenase n=1 Tax=Alteristakelama amylovorans TaxID=3096166 RepID=UPI002FC5C778
MSDIEAAIVQLDGPRQLVWRRETLAAPTGNQIRCATIVSVISPGTELAAYTGLAPLRPGNPYPRVQGYCNVARVIDAGPDVTDLASGDVVLTFSSHRSHFTIDAGEVLVKLPADGDYGKLACAYLYHLGYNAVLRSDVRAGSTVLVIGLGVLGLTSVAMAALAGARVHAVSNQASAARIATAFGARAVHARDAVDAALAGGADVVIATTGGWDDWQMALRNAATMGRIAVLGFPGRGLLAPQVNPLDSQYFYAKQLRIEAVGMSPSSADDRGFLPFNERANLAFLADAIHRGDLDPSPLISGRLSGFDIIQAYEAIVQRDNDALTFILEWGG